MTLPAFVSPAQITMKGDGSSANHQASILLVESESDRADELDGSLVVDGTVYSVSTGLAAVSASGG